MTVSEVEVERKRFLSELLTRIVIVLGVLCVIATVIIQAVVLQSLHDSVEANARLSDQVLKIAKQTSAVAKRDRECSTPGESCYEEQRANVTDLVEDINRITLLTAVCVDDLPRAASALEVRNCVVKKVARESGDMP